MSVVQSKEGAVEQVYITHDLKYFANTIQKVTVVAGLKVLILGSYGTGHAQKK